MKFFLSNQHLIDSVSLSNLTRKTDNYFVLSLEVFPPSGQVAFHRTGIIGIRLVLSNQTFKPSHKFRPFYFSGDLYPYFEGSTGTHKSSSTAIIIGLPAGGSVLVLFALLAGIYAFRQKKRAETAHKQNNPFGVQRNAPSGQLVAVKRAQRGSMQGGHEFKTEIELLSRTEKEKRWNKKLL